MSEINDTHFYHLERRQLFDWFFVIAGFWLVGGAYLDAWAHHHLDSSLETFFTPWHGLLYSGFFALAAVLFVTFLWGRSKGFDFRHALPEGYGMSLVGTLIFLCAGFGDMLWHIAFGIEVDIEALFSPTHILLVAGGSFMVTGPLRNLFKSKEEGRIGFLHVCSLLFLFSFLTFMTQFIHPYVRPWMSLFQKTTNPFHGQAMGMSGVIITAAILAGVFLPFIKRWRVFFGSFAFIFTLNGLALSILEDHYWFALSALSAGLCIDVFLYAIRNKVFKLIWFRVASFVIPFILFLFYVVFVMFYDGTWWSVHSWTGVPVIAGIVGLLVGYVVSSSRIS